MAKRIIKPDSGNTLVLQEDNGSIDALTIDTSGNVQLAGSLTAGTLGSGVVFPAGHVLQVVHTETSETNTLDLTYTNYFEVPLTLKSSSSDVIVTFTFQYLINAVNSGFGVKIYRGDSSSVTTSDTAVWTKNLESLTGPFTFYSSQSGRYSVSSITGEDTITGKSAGDTIYYGLFARKYDSGSSIIFPASNTTDGFFSSLIMEIQK